MKLPGPAMSVGAPLTPAVAVTPTHATALSVLGYVTVGRGLTTTLSRSTGGSTTALSGTAGEHAGKTHTELKYCFWHCTETKTQPDAADAVGPRLWPDLVVLIGHGIERGHPL